MRRLVWGIIVAGIALRTAAIFNDLWLDELWSLEFANAATSWLDIFTEFSRDNNHWLNTLFMYGVGDLGEWRYRLLSLASGSGLLLLLPKVCRDDKQILSTALLLSFSYLLVLYSSEARGYAPMLLCVLICYVTLLSFLATKSARAAVIFNLGCALGLLAHLSFFLFYLVTVVVAILFRDRKRPLSLLKIHLFPPVFCLAVKYFASQPLSIGGGPKAHTGQIILNTILLTLGFPEVLGRAVGHPMSSITFAVFFLALMLLEVYLIARDDRRKATLFGVAMLLPLLAAAIGNPEVLFVRYFLITILFWLLASGSLLARGLGSNSMIVKMGAGVICFCYMIGNLLNTAMLLRFGRGNFSGLMPFLAASSNYQDSIPQDSGEENVLRIAAQNEFQTQMMLAYFWRKEKVPFKFVVHNTLENEKRPAPFFIASDQQRGGTPVKEFELNGCRYFLVAYAPFAVESGFNWGLYRLSDFTSGNKDLPSIE